MSVADGYRLQHTHRLAWRKTGLRCSAMVHAHGDLRNQHLLLDLQVGDAGALVLADDLDPLAAGALDLGPWEQVFYAEFDGQRRKRLVVKVMGE